MLDKLLKALRAGALCSLLNGSHTLLFLTRPAQTVLLGSLL